MTHTFVTREDNDPKDSMHDWDNEKKLNEVLRYLSNFYFRNDNSDGFIPYSQLKDYLDKRSISYSYCLSMILYLSRDNKIDISPREYEMNGGEPMKIRLNFEGHKFMWLGGYVTQRDDAIQLRSRQATVQAVSARNENLLWIVGAALVAMELISYLTDHWIEVEKILDLHTC